MPSKMFATVKEDCAKTTNKIMWVHAYCPNWYWYIPFFKVKINHTNPATRKIKLQHKLWRTRRMRHREVTSLCTAITNDLKQRLWFQPLADAKGIRNRDMKSITSLLVWKQNQQKPAQEEEHKLWTQSSKQFSLTNDRSRVTSCYKVLPAEDITKQHTYRTWNKFTFQSRVTCNVHKVADDHVIFDEAIFEGMR